MGFLSKEKKDNIDRKRGMRFSSQNLYLNHK